MDTPVTSRQLPKAATLVDLGEKEYNPYLCVICQDPKDSTPLTTGDKGRESVKRAAELREDNVYKRIKTYHSGTNDHIYSNITTLQDVSRSMFMLHILNQQYRPNLIKKKTNWIKKVLAAHPVFYLVKL